MPTPEQANPTSSPVSTKIHITAADQTVLKLAAREFEHALARSDLFQDLAQSIKPGNDRAIRSARARDRVLDVAAQQGPESVTEIPTGARAESGSIRAQWELVERFSGTHPVTKPGQQIYRDLEGCAERTPGFVENLKHSLAAFPNFTGSATGQSALVDLGRSFQTPVYDGDLAVSTIQQTVNILFGDHLGEFGKALDGLDPQVGLAVQKAVDDRRQFYTAEIIRSNGKKASEAIKTVAHPNRVDVSNLNLNSFHNFGVQHPIIADNGDSLVVSANEHPPAIDPKIEPHVNLSKAQEQIQEFLPKVNPSWSPEYTAEVLREGTEAIADFSTHFPASVKTAMETTPFNAIKTVITETGGGGHAGAWEGIGRALTQVAEGLAQNARSFAGFTSAPNVDDKNYADTQPWEFPALHDKIYQTVTASIKAVPEKKAIYDAATEFALLQRFFRLGFDGFLGSEFPVEKFASLAADIRTAAAPASSRTLRWNARPGLLEVTTLRNLLSDQEQFSRFKDAIVKKAALEALIQTLKDFESAIDSVYDYNSAAGWQSKWSEFSQWRKRWLDQWEAKVNALQGSVARLSPDEIEYLRKQTAAMRLRESLGVDVDDEQILRQRTEKNPAPLDRFDPGSSL
jgi:hypothetical protein